MTSATATPKLPTSFWWAGAILVAGVTFAVVRTVTGVGVSWTLWLSLGSLSLMLASTLLGPTRPRAMQGLMFAAAMLMVAAVIVDVLAHR
jgi:hypothetical protein